VTNILNILDKKMMEHVTTLLTLPDLVMVKILKFLMHNVNDVENLAFTNRQLKYFVQDNFANLYYDDLKIDNKSFKTNLKNMKPILSLELCIHVEANTCPKYEINPEFFRPEDNSPILMIIHPQSTSAILQKNIPTLNFKLLRKLTLTCGNRHAINLYLDTRDIVFKHINNEALEELDFSFCFLGRGPNNDDILKRFSTNLLYPNLKKLTLNFFDNGSLEWGDYTSKTLKHHLYGMALTQKLKVVKLLNLEGNLFHTIYSFLDKLSRMAPVSKSEILLDNRRATSANIGFFPLSRLVSYEYQENESTVDFTITFGDEIP